MNMRVRSSVLNTLVNIILLVLSRFVNNYVKFLTVIAVMEL